MVEGAFDRYGNPWKSVQHVVRMPPQVVCKFEPFGKAACITAGLTAWPSWWARLWFRVFFGWRFRYAKSP
jgi:hypothetical protein